MVDWIKEARDLARVAGDGKWNLATVEYTRVVGWDTNFLDQPAVSGIQHLVIGTLKMEVRYREQA